MVAIVAAARINNEVRTILGRSICPGKRSIFFGWRIRRSYDALPSFQYCRPRPTRVVNHFLLPDACVEGLIEEVRRFTYGSDQTDDATAVLVRSR